jgi:hypothetical protein
MQERHGGGERSVAVVGKEQSEKVLTKSETRNSQAIFIHHF